MTKIGKNYLPPLKLKWTGGIFFQDFLANKEAACKISHDSVEVSHSQKKHLNCILKAF